MFSYITIADLEHIQESKPTCNTGYMPHDIRQQRYMPQRANDGSDASHLHEACEHAPRDAASAHGHLHLFGDTFVSYMRM